MSFIYSFENVLADCSNMLLLREVANKLVRQYRMTKETASMIEVRVNELTVVDAIDIGAREDIFEILSRYL